MLYEVPKREPLLVGEWFRIDTRRVHSCLARGRLVLNSITLPRVVRW